ncbi:Unknown protein sequence [Pseudomonas syringae pv. cilantro]|uniref:Uncharacterized protein n=1 Tax=Pseudomonas syringae pv. cilantro TaxID=81035 RepID=A0A0N1JNH2_PSESX|nr:Unknown protein sequence [Pseudomonas syringae pv. cilantro]
MHPRNQYVWPEIILGRVPDNVELSGRRKMARSVPVSSRAAC